MVEAGTLQLDAALQDRFVQLGIPTETDGIEERTGSELREQVEAMGAAMGVSTAMGDGPRAARGGRFTTIADPVAGSGFFPYPFPERLDSRIAPGVGRRDEAAPRGCFDLPVKQRD